MKLNFATVRKTVAAVVGLVAEAVNAGLVHGTAAKIAAIVIAIATAAGVYAVPNDAKVPPLNPAAK